MKHNILILFIFSFCSCRSDRAPVPKPHAFPRVLYPEKGFTAFSDPDCPFTFEYPSYGQVNKRTDFFGEAPANPCWFDLNMQALNARLHVSYHNISEHQPFDQLVGDAFKIANKINQRSNYMDEIRVANAQGVEGLVLDFKGPAASPMHFYLSDSTRHFFKASLYFDTQSRPDSLEPISTFIKEDIAHLINSFEWR